MAYILGVFGTVVLLAGALYFFAAQTADQQIRGLLFWVMAAVLYSGEVVVAAINRLRK